MNSMWRYSKRFQASESGATAIEYGLIMALMALVLIGALSSTGDATQDKWDGVADDIVDAHESVR